jgi:hypothetical protein
VPASTPKMKKRMAGSIRLCMVVFLAPIIETGEGLVKSILQSLNIDKNL